MNRFFQGIAFAGLIGADGSYRYRPATGPSSADRTRPDAPNATSRCPIRSVPTPTSSGRPPCRRDTRPRRFSAIASTSPAERDGKLLTIGLDRRTGDVLWQAEAPHKTLEEVHNTASHATPSPATDGEVVVSFFGSCGLFCLRPRREAAVEHPDGTVQERFRFREFADPRRRPRHSLPGPRHRFVSDGGRQAHRADALEDRSLRVPAQLLHAGDLGGCRAKSRSSWPPRCASSATISRRERSCGRCAASRGSST